MVLVKASDKSLEQNIATSELEHVELGMLKGNHGDQNYLLPEAPTWKNIRPWRFIANGSMRCLV